MVINNTLYFKSHSQLIWKFQFILKSVQELFVEYLYLQLFEIYKFEPPTQCISLGKSFMTYIYTTNTDILKFILD